MTDTNTHETVADLAHRLLSTDDTALAAEVHRLAAFVVDHDEHIKFASGGASSVGSGSSAQPLKGIPGMSDSDLMRRIAPQHPDAATSEIDPLPSQPINTPNVHGDA